VGFWCDYTCLMVNPDPRSGQYQACPWNLAHDLPLASPLEELAADRDVDLAPVTPSSKNNRLLIKIMSNDS
jgi:hypothetical protein